MPASACRITAPRVVRQRGGNDGGVELVGFGLAGRDAAIELGVERALAERGRWPIASAAAAARRAPPAGTTMRVVRRGLGAARRRVDAPSRTPLDDGVVDPVLDRDPAAGVRKRRGVLVSFSVNSSSGALPA